MTSGSLYISLLHPSPPSLFRKLEGYSAPACGAKDVYSVLSKYSTLLYAGPGSFTKLQRKLEIKKFSFDLESSVACLTSTPGEFESLDSLVAAQEARKLRDNIQDLVDVVQLRGNNAP